MENLEKLRKTNANDVTLYIICETETHIHYHLGHDEKKFIEVISYHKETQTTAIFVTTTPHRAGLKRKWQRGNNRFPEYIERELSSRK